jgi:acetylornithine deacetylase/succinyl-diaminopimelate desuccinylase-like protein
MPSIGWKADRVNDKLASFMFPPPEKLLGDYLRLEPHTRNGQWEAARYFMELVDDHGLGDAQILEYPQFPDGSGESYPLLKIMSSPGLSFPARMMTWLGHLDTVEPGKKQLGHDALTIEQRDGRTIGKGRGTLDMGAGNIAFFSALRILRENHRARSAIQLLLPSQEEGGSGVLYQALRKGHVEHSEIGATTEILVGDDGKKSPLYFGRTGRIGINATFEGKALHTGAADRYPEELDFIAIRYFARAIDEMIDRERCFAVENAYPGDTQGFLRTRSRAIPGLPGGEIQGLSVARAISQHFDIHHSDPNLSPEMVIAQMHHYLVEQANIPAECIDLALEHRHGVPFIQPYLTPPDHPLVSVAHQYAEEIEGGRVEKGAANGVAEDGLLFHMNGTNMVGWSPVGKDAHEDSEEVDIGSITDRTRWLVKLVEHDGVF